MLELLGSLDVENSTETCELVLKTLLKEAPLPEVVQKFDILDDKYGSLSLLLQDTDLF